MTDYGLLFLLLLFVVAFLYASVGHGGASGYLALMAVWGVTSTVAKPIALILNCCVSLLAFIAFYKEGYFNKKLFLSLAVASIPFSFLGSKIPLQEHVYKSVLAVMLCIAAARLFFVSKEQKQISEPPLIALLVIGSIIGLLSGMIGIGGGIILSPLLIIMAWSTVKETSGVSALFIFVNSIAGLFGLYQKGIAFTTDMKYMLVVAILGGLLGSLLGAKKFQVDGLKKILAFGLLIASLKLFFT